MLFLASSFVSKKSKGLASRRTFWACFQSNAMLGTGYTVGGNSHPCVGWARRGWKLVDFRSSLSVEYNTHLFKPLWRRLAQVGLWSDSVYSLSVRFCKSGKFVEKWITISFSTCFVYDCPNLYGKLYRVLISLLEAFDFFMQQKKSLWFKWMCINLPLSPCWMIQKESLAISNLLA